MIIEAKPMLQRDKRAYEVYISQLRAERDCLSDAPKKAYDKINLEIEASKARIVAINNELKYKH